MPEAATTSNPHALGPASGASARHCPRFAMLSCAAPDAVWPLRIGRTWPGLEAMLAPRNAAYDVNGGPMVAGAVALERLALLLDSGRWPKSWPRVICARAVVAEGPVREALQALCRDGRIALHDIRVWERAMLERAAAPDPKAYWRSFMSSGQRKRLRQKKQGLESALGPLSLKIAQRQDDLREALDVFVRIERSGWKGRNGTALAQDSAGLAYVEDVLTSMAEADGAFAAVLRAGATPVAAGLFLRAGGEAVFWKTAYDETQAKASPGVLFDLALTDWLYAQSWFERLDAGHDDSVDPTTLVWKQRRRMADILVDLAPGSARGRLVLMGLRLRERLRLLKRRYRAK